jgi:hypothetical protein
MKASKLDNLTMYDYKYIATTLKSHNLIGGFVTLDKNNKLKGLYEFKPKGKTSYYLNISNCIIRAENLKEQTNETI